MNSTTDGNETTDNVDLTKPKVNLIDIASPNMTPEAEKVVHDAIERSAEVMNKIAPTERDIDLLEQLAAIEHERWSDWQKWCHKVLRENNPSPEQGDILERWDRQIETPYAELSEAEKQSDRDQVARYLPIVQAHYQQKLERLIGEAKPKNNWLEGSDLFYGQDEGVGEFEQNLLKELEGVIK